MWRERRAEAARLLAQFDADALARWAGDDPRAFATLQRLLFDDDERTRWRAVEALGIAAEVLAGRSSLERVREILRRVLWLMNDESGGVLWSGPQVIAAVLARVPALRAEFGAIVASFLEEEPFRVGARWALWRLAETSPDLVWSAADVLRMSLRDPDAAVRGHAALALRAARAELPDLVSDRATFTFFDSRSGELRIATVAAAAAGTIGS
jgi:HEAT repeat protein